ncbi:MAG: asparagine synthase [Candidatus Thorarchaeota archaeon]|nr:asparagine synthase [Candidatus Thorarchaeota archaeon]
MSVFEQVKLRDDHSADSRPDLLHRAAETESEISFSDPLRKAETPVMRVDRNALELQFQIEGELFGNSVFKDALNIPTRPFSEDLFTNHHHIALHTQELGQLSNELTSAIQRCLEPHANRRVGLLLSGGIDSSLAAYHTKKVFPRTDLVAYHTDWGIPELSEREYASIAADFAGVELRVVDTSAESQLSVHDEALQACHTISYSVVPVFMALKRMVEDGVDVAVNALGLDELFAAYNVHRLYYRRRSPHIIPYSRRLLRLQKYRGAVLRWGTDRSWMLSTMAPKAWMTYVLDSDQTVSEVYDRHIRRDDLWNSLHLYLLEKMVSTFANMMSRAGKAAGIEVLYPYLDRRLIEFCMSLSPAAKYNKAPLRTLMRTKYGFSEAIASSGENWDKRGWGGTPVPYFRSKLYMEKVRPDMNLARDWFTEDALRLLDLSNKPTTDGLHMALFLKMIEHG